MFAILSAASMVSLSHPCQRRQSQKRRLETTGCPARAPHAAHKWQCMRGACAFTWTHTVMSLYACVCKREREDVQCSCRTEGSLLSLQATGNTVECDLPTVRATSLRPLSYDGLGSCTLLTHSPTYGRSRDFGSSCPRPTTTRSRS